MAVPTLTIEEVAKEFVAWRSNKEGQSKIPEVLSQKVKILLMTHHHSNVLRRLGITHQQARNKGLLPLPSIVKNHSKNLPPAFVKIPMTHSTTNTYPSSGSGLTLQRGDLKLLLNSPSNEQIQLIINRLLM